MASKYLITAGLGLGGGTRYLPTLGLGVGEATLTPPADFVTLAERLGGEGLLELYALTVTAPATRTWYLAAMDLDADAAYPGAPAYQGIVMQSSGAITASSLGGQGQGGLTLTLLDQYGTYGSGAGATMRRFSDWFAAPVAGFAEPYDLDSATLTVSLAFRGLTGSDVLPVARYRLQPEGVRWQSGPPASLTLQFGEDVSFHRPLPRRVLTATTWPQLPDGLVGYPIPLVFGQGVILPMLQLDKEGTLFAICESPLDTPVILSPRLFWAVAPNEELGTEEFRRVWMPQDPSQGPSPPAVYNPDWRGWPYVPSADYLSQGTADDYNLSAARAQRIDLGALGYVVKAVEFRAKTSGGAANGNISVALVKDKNNLPSDELVDPAASVEYDAAQVGATYATHTVTFERGVVVPGEQPVWLVFAFGKTSGGNVMIEGDSTGGYAHGLSAQKDSGTNSGWHLQTGSKKQRKPVGSDFTGGGLLLRADLDGAVERLAHLKKRKYKGLLVGRVPRKDAQGVERMTAARAYQRFTISDLPGSVVAAQLKLFYGERVGPIANLEIREVTDVGTLETTDWGPAELALITTEALTTDDSAGTARFTVDCTTAYNAAKTAGRSTFCLEFRYANESEDAWPNGHYYVLGGEGSKDAKGIRLEVLRTAGEDLHFALEAVTWVSDGSADPEGHGLARLTLNHPIGELRLGVELLAGMHDDASNTYTGTGGIIERGADVLRWLVRHPMGIGLESNLAWVNLASFDTARERLAAANWFPLAGAIMEPQDSQVWLARVARCCQSVVYQDALGRMTMWAEGRSAEGPVRHVKAWEHGQLMAGRGTLTTGTAVWPVSRLDVYYARDLLGVANFPTGPRRLYQVPEWEALAIISPDQCAPEDAVRQAQAVALQARYGYRGWTEPGLRGVEDLSFGPTAENTYEFVPFDAPGVETGVRLLRALWDANWTHVRPFDAVEVQLPWFALAWRTMDEVTLESYHFPSAYVRWSLNRPMAPGQAIEDGVLRFYAARRGLFSVRALRVTANAGQAQFPVSVTLKLLAWESD